MKKHVLTLLTTLLPMVAMVTLLGACGEDDKEDNNGGGVTIKDKHISKIVEETNGTIRERVFTYDSKGRITTMETTVNSPSESSVYKRTYQYSETTIIERNESNNTLSPYDSALHTYELEDGKIVLDTETKDGNSVYYHIAYDTDGYIREIFDYVDVDNDRLFLHSARSVNWKNGNLKSAVYRGVEVPYWENTNLPWTIGTFIDINTSIIPDTDPILFATGFYGKMPRNIPSIAGDVSYEYTITAGMLTNVKKKVVDPYGERDAEISIYNISWE